MGKIENTLLTEYVVGVYTQRVVVDMESRLTLLGLLSAGPERKRYEVTDAGRQSVEQWLLTPVAPAGDVQADIFAKTVIALMLDDDAGRLLDLQRTEHMARMRELTRLKQDGDLRTVLLADHALFHIEADLRWMETTAARLGELREEVRS